MPSLVGYPRTFTIVSTTTTVSGSALEKTYGLGEYARLTMVVKLASANAAGNITITYGSINASGTLVGITETKAMAGGAETLVFEPKASAIACEGLKVSFPVGSVVDYASLEII